MRPNHPLYQSAKAEWPHFGQSDDEEDPQRELSSSHTRHQIARTTACRERVARESESGTRGDEGIRTSAEFRLGPPAFPAERGPPQHSLCSPAADRPTRRTTVLNRS